MRKIVTSIAYLYLFLCASSCFAKPTPSKALLDWQHSGEYFTYQQHKVFYHDTKDVDKEPIIMLHGFPSSSWDWHFLWSSLNNNYRLITIDMIGFGFSDKPKDMNYSIAEQANLVEALLKQLNVKHAHFLVHDYGTYVAQELMSRKMDNERSTTNVELNSLTILNGPTSQEELKLRLIQKALTSPIGGIISNFSTAYVFKLNFSPIFGKNTRPSKQDLIDFWYVIEQQNGQRISHKLMHYYKEGFQYQTRWLNALQNSNIPILHISGLADPVAGKSMIEQFKVDVPNAQVITLHEIGHYPHVESPEQVLQYYKPFLLSSE